MSDELWAARDRDGDRVCIYRGRPEDRGGMFFWEFGKCKPVLTGTFDAALPSLQPGQCIEVKIVPVTQTGKDGES